MKKTAVVVALALSITACSWNKTAAKRGGRWVERAATAPFRAASNLFPSRGTEKHVVCGPALDVLGDIGAPDELDFPVVQLERMPRDWKKNREAAKAACIEHGFPAVASLEETAEALRNLRQMNRTGVFETVRLRFTDEDFLVLSESGMFEPESSDRRRIKTAR